MLNAKHLLDIAVLKTAVLTCNFPKVKKEILCLADSSYSTYKDEPIFERMRQWNLTVEKEATTVINNFCIPINGPREKVIGLIKPIAKRMLCWMRYHEDRFDITRDDIAKLIDCSVFTPEGIVDSQLFIEKLVLEETLNVRLRYRLSCFYFIEDKTCKWNKKQKFYSQILWRKIPQKYKTDFYRKTPKEETQTELVKPWFYQYENSTRDEYTNKPLWSNGFKKSLENGNVLGVKYCLKKLCSRHRKTALIEGSMEVISFKNERDVDCDTLKYTKNTNEKIVYPMRYYIYYSDKNFISNRPWVAVEYFVDILHHLFTEMTESEQLELLKRDIGTHNYSNVLEYFLGWPYQDYFMEVAKLTWGILSESNFWTLLLRIASKIQTADDYDYRELFNTFWRQSPEHYKRYVLNDNVIVGLDSVEKKGKHLLLKMFDIDRFTHMDEKNIKLILKDASLEERLNIVHSADGRKICLTAVKYCRFKLVEMFMECCGLRGGEMRQYKQNLIVSDEAKFTIGNFIQNEQFDIIDRIITWCLNSVDEIRQLKKIIAFREGYAICKNFILDNKWNHLEQFITWCALTECDITEFKKAFSDNVAYDICKDFISYKTTKDILDENFNSIIGEAVVFKGGKWEQVEMLLTWLFSSEDEIDDFKKDFITKTSYLYDECRIITAIHLDLVSSNKWDEAETFFMWLKLSPEEINELKKETIFSNSAMQDIDYSLTNEYDDYRDYGGDKWLKIELLIRWCLTDAPSLTDFRNKFNKKHGFLSYEEGGYVLSKEKRDALKKFDALYDQILSDLQNDGNGIKRKYKMEDNEFGGCFSKIMRQN